MKMMKMNEDDDVIIIIKTKYLHIKNRGTSKYV
jgi:hypothetical protein